MAPVDRKLYRKQNPHDGSGENNLRCVEVQTSKLLKHLQRCEEETRRRMRNEIHNLDFDDYLPETTKRMLAPSRDNDFQIPKNLELDGWKNLQIARTKCRRNLYKRPTVHTLEERSSMNKRNSNEESSWQMTQMIKHIGTRVRANQSRSSRHSQDNQIELEQH